MSLDYIFNHWYWGRAKVGEYNVIISDMILHKRYGNKRLMSFMCAQGDAIVSDDSHITKAERSGIGIPPLKRALAAVRAQRVLARRRAIPYDVESFEIGIRIGKTRNLRRAHIYSNLYEIPNQTAQRKSAYTSFTSKFVAAAASSSRASFASSSTARTSSSMCCASCSF